MMLLSWLQMTSLKALEKLVLALPSVESHEVVLGKCWKIYRIKLPVQMLDDDHDDDAVFFAHRGPHSHSHTHALYGYTRLVCLCIGRISLRHGWCFIMAACPPAVETQGFH